MERALLWFKCAAVHDPVRPVIKKPAVLGWMAKHRRVDLEIERPLRGEELLRQMKVALVTPSLQADCNTCWVNSRSFSHRPSNALPS